MGGNAVLNAVVVSKINSSSREVESTSHYTIFAQIPIHITTTGTVTLRSVVSCSSTIESDGNRYKVDQYTENGARYTVPTRTVQEYPDTLDDNYWASINKNMRSFYFPHDKVSTINIDLQAVGESFDYYMKQSANDLFSIEKIGGSSSASSSSFTMEITPNYVADYKTAVLQKLDFLPPKHKNEILTEQQEILFDKFTDYIGVGYVEWRIGQLSGFIRIVIYDENPYDENIIVS